VERLLDLFFSLAPAASYAVLAVGAAVENLLPPVPADTFVLFGGILAGRGVLAPIPLFLVTWTANVAGALGVYWAGRRFGRPFFQTGLGRRLLNPRQFSALVRFHARWGWLAIFLSRFVPGFRALVPVFAGVSRMSPLAVALPVFVASGLWYGVLIRAGYVTGENLDALLGALGRVNQAGLALAVAFFVILGILWYRHRHPAEGGPSGDGGPSEDGGPPARGEAREDGDSDAPWGGRAP
jgi:membrane protein DedA with SNARE-associated domain